MTQQAESKKAFVCGWPIAHSRSPIIHGFWLKKYGLSGSYEKLAISPDQLADFLTNFKNLDFVGGNFTIPHKEKVKLSLQITDDAARLIGAVNTVWLEEGNLVGGNTDWIGFAANMDDCSPGWDNPGQLEKPAIVLGAGGAARGIVYALRQRGFENITIVNRTKEKADRIASEFPGNITTASFEDLSRLPTNICVLINTTSLGMSGKNPLPPDLVNYLSQLDKTTIVSDIVYIPLETELLKRAANAGLKTVDGLGMLLHQAVPGFEKWFGIRPEVTEELRALILMDIGETG